MKKGNSKQIVAYLLFNCLVLISLNMQGQEFVKPIRGRILLSGNFGELRATHFHAGVDFRTGGVEGLPVVAVKDGQIARVRVSPVGYGQALYVEHGDGTTTVYGHLQRFVPKISEVVRGLQYQKESFDLDENLKPYNLFFKQGDTIAYSGNSGSSGGPHLHFEVRDTRSENTINPLKYYKIDDNRPPVVKRAYLYAVSETGCVEMIHSCPLKVAGGGQYIAGQIIVPEGKIGVGLFAMDYMNDSWNKLGIYKIRLSVADETLFQMIVDTCAFDQACFINEIKDFDYYKRQETVYRCFGNYQQLIAGVSNKDKGLISIKKDAVVKLKIDLEDINGNIASVIMSLKGGVPISDKGDDQILSYMNAHLLELPGCQVRLDSGALFCSVKKTLKVEKDSIAGQNVFVLSEKDVPLLKKAKLFIAGHFDSKALICEVTPQGRKYPVVTQREEGGLSALVGYLSRYTVVEDRLAPSIVYQGIFPGRILKFKIKDNLSGIAKYGGEVNGQWCLFAYDPRYDLFQCSFNEPAFVRGAINEVKVYVEDRVGNRNEVIAKVKF